MIEARSKSYVSRVVPLTGSELVDLSAKRLERAMAWLVSLVVTGTVIDSGPLVPMVCSVDCDHVSKDE